MKRRHFIKTAGAAMAVLPAFRGIPLGAMALPSIFNNINEDSDRVLVLIQLNGGNDGLNMVLPIDQYDNLANVRGNILIPQSTALQLTDITGLHPAMTGIKSLYDNARVGVVQSVAYPNQNRSHFRSTDIWTSGSPANQVWNTGWMGRYFDDEYPDYPNGYPNATHPHPFAITMGNLVSPTCQGIASNFSMTLEDPFTLGQLPSGQVSSVPNTPYGEELTFLRIAIAQTNAYTNVITQSANAGANLATYPNGRLSDQLRHVARLISGGLRTRIYVVSLGGFDTHANQVLPGSTTTGTHAELLRNLSESVAAFQEDLRLLNVERRVISMTFSEFGRRIRSNAANGTDHGTAAPLMLFGSCVNPQILGNNPVISANVSVEEGVPMQYDFRDVYGSILMDWFEVPETDVRRYLYQGFTHLPLLQPCQTATSTDASVVVQTPGIQVHPNPLVHSATIVFRIPADSARARLSIFDAMGSEVQVLFDMRLSSGEHTMTWDARKLPAGVYFCRLTTSAGSQQVSRVVKH